MPSSEGVAGPMSALHLLGPCLRNRYLGCRQSDVIRTCEWKKLILEVKEPFLTLMGIKNGSIHPIDCPSPILHRTNLSKECVKSMSLNRL